MATYSYAEQKEYYGNFKYALAEIIVGDKKLSENKDGITLSDLEIDLTSGFEASMATWVFYNVYDEIRSEFLFDKVSQYILLGSAVRVYLGYGTKAREVFRGFIARVNFLYRPGEMPGIRVTAYDVKGMMMANRSNRQLKANTWGKAVREIFDRSVYQNMQSGEIIRELSVSKTPDEEFIGSEADNADVTIEMISESDYEFVVRAAKKFNYEFYVIGGQVIFRAARSDVSKLFEFTPADLFLSLDVEYDITGLANSVEVRATDIETGRMIYARKRVSNKISTASRTKDLLEGSEKVVVDPTVHSKQEAECRASFHMDDISYRYGTLRAEITGLPELIPGKFISLTGFGTAVSNTWYLVGVRHLMTDDRGFRTQITGRAAKLE